MKNLKQKLAFIFLLAGVLSVSSFAQSTSLTVDNRTDCDYRLLSAEATVCSPFNNCTVGTTGSFVCIPAHTSYTVLACGSSSYEWTLVTLQPAEGTGCDECGPAQEIIRATSCTAKQDATFNHCICERATATFKDPETVVIY
jgi:hypothetical protein